MITYRDLSSKIDPDIAAVLVPVLEISYQVNIPFFFIGAGARDLFFTAIYGIKPIRSTEDLDFGIKVNSWNEVNNLVDMLIETREFTPINKNRSKLRHTNQRTIDIVPFGNIENDGKIKWSDEDSIMTTLGYKEAYEFSMEYSLEKYTPHKIRVCTPPALVLLKLIAWDEKFPLRAKDAKDIEYILDKYLDAGNDYRLRSDDNDLRNEEDFDYGYAGARLVGRDIVKIADEKALTLFISILDREVNPDSGFRLITNMIGTGNPFFEEKFGRTQSLLIQLQKGIRERRSPHQ